MGQQKSKLSLVPASKETLKAGDHIVKRTSFLSGTHAIFTNEKTEACIFLDRTTGVITETTLSNFCRKHSGSTTILRKSKKTVDHIDSDSIASDGLFRYVYPGSVSCVPVSQAVANAKKFLIHGKFSYCCLTSSFDFAYACKMNKYTSNICYPTIPNIPTKVKQSTRTLSSDKKRGSSRGNFVNIANCEETEEKMYDVELGDAGTRRSFDLTSSMDTEDINTALTNLHLFSRQVSSFRHNQSELMDKMTILEKKFNLLLTKRELREVIAMNLDENVEESENTIETSTICPLAEDQEDAADNAQSKHFTFEKTKMESAEVIGTHSPSMATLSALLEQSNDRSGSTSSAKAASAGARDNIPASSPHQPGLSSTVDDRICQEVKSVTSLEETEEKSITRPLHFSPMNPISSLHASIASTAKKQKTKSATRSDTPSLCSRKSIDLEFTDESADGKVILTKITPRVVGSSLTPEHAANGDSDHGSSMSISPNKLPDEIQRMSQKIPAVNGRKERMSMQETSMTPTLTPSPDSLKISKSTSTNMSKSGFMIVNR